VTPHESLVRDGPDLRGAAHVTMAQAALGAHIDFETLDGSEEIAVPAGTQTGREVRLRGRGVPHLQARGRGDLIVSIVVDTPEELTRTQEELLRQFAAERGEEVAHPETGLRSRIRGAFK
jgi:molecular chaperone DnaJ